jgi:23S rRNA G2445 N2-methylase RlmL
LKNAKLEGVSDRVEMKDGDARSLPENGTSHVKIGLLNP